MYDNPCFYLHTSHIFMGRAFILSLFTFGIHAGTYRHSAYRISQLCFFFYYSLCSQHSIFCCCNFFLYFTQKISQYRWNDIQISKIFVIRNRWSLKYYHLFRFDFVSMPKSRFSNEYSLRKKYVKVKIWNYDIRVFFSIAKSSYYCYSYCVFFLPSFQVAINVN